LSQNSFPQLLDLLPADSELIEIVDFIEILLFLAVLPDFPGNLQTVVENSVELLKLSAEIEMRLLDVLDEVFDFAGGRFLAVVTNLVFSLALGVRFEEIDAFCNFGQVSCVLVDEMCLLFLELEVLPH
jgi:hypothetical protein